MSHQDAYEEYLESFFDMMEKSENDSLKSLTTTDSEEAKSSDDTVSTSQAVDPNNLSVSVDLSAEADKTAIIEKDPSASACVISDSEASSLGTSDSLYETYPWLRPRSGIWGFIDKVGFGLKIARQRGYLLPFELMCLAFTISCCFMGAQYWRLCPANANIPRYVFANGAIGTFSACVQIMDSAWKFAFRRYSQMWKYFCAFGIGWVAVITTLIEMTEFYTMSYSFQRYEENYCNETFYWFVYYKNIAFGVLMSLAAMIYIPSYDYNHYIDYM